MACNLKALSPSPSLDALLCRTSDGCRLQFIILKILHYYSILEFFHAIVIIPMQVLLLCSNYAHFIIEKTPQT